MSDTALIVADEPNALMPMSMGNTFHAYTSMQKEIDKAMPDQIMTIQGRQFRKKGYWRAVRAAFSLKVWCVSEERIESDGTWGYSVLYRAEGRNGMSADGDGVCMASEKRGGQATVHNVRSHAHTRAFNRAVSNLVGFGEVSAEEVERDEPVVEAKVVPQPVKSAPAVAPADAIPFDDEQEPTQTEPPEGFVTVKSVTDKPGETNGKPWMLYIVKFSDGREASTFDGPLSISAKAAMASKAPVIPTLMPGKKAGSWNLMNLVRA